MNSLCALIPLDTTEASEAALQMVPLLKEMGFEKVRLLSVSKSKKDSDREALADYLRENSSKVSALGMDCEMRVVEGDPVEEILAQANSSDVDLIVIATHGRTGIARLRLGSVGEKLIKNSSCPRLVIGPNVEIDLGSYDLTHILVPLDGSELSELSIPIARHLARICEAQVDLIRAVSLTSASAGDGMAAGDLLETMLEAAKNYLGGVKAQFQDLDVTTNVVTGSPDAAVIEYMKNSTNDLVVMVSRGRTGIARTVMGSTTERILHGPDPVLVFEPGEDRSRLFQAARAVAD